MQHALPMMLEACHNGQLTLEKLVEKMCHAPTDCLRVAQRGYLREGYWANLALVDMNRGFAVSKDTILYQCGWPPLEGKSFRLSVTHTVVSGHLAYHNGQFDETVAGKRLAFRV